MDLTGREFSIGGLLGNMGISGMINGMISGVAAWGRDESFGRNFAKGFASGALTSGLFYGAGFLASNTSIFNSGGAISQVMGNFFKNLSNASPVVQGALKGITAGMIGSSVDISDRLIHGEEIDWQDVFINFTIDATINSIVEVVPAQVRANKAASAQKIMKFLEENRTEAWSTLTKWTYAKKGAGTDSIAAMNAFFGSIGLFLGQDIQSTAYYYNDNNK